VCDEAEGGLDALERMKKSAASGRAYAVAVVDLELPELDARTIARSVREASLLARTGLILLTNVGRPGDAARAGEWGYDAYFVKPMDNEQLQATLDEAVRRHRVDPSSGTQSHAGARAEAPLITRFTLAEQRRSRVRVLVVEDNPLDQLVVLSALRRVGYAPEAVTTAEAALAAAARQSFDILFLDLSLSGTDGIELASALRSAEAGARRTPIVALTGRVREEERMHCLAAGIVDFLPKPIDLELMCATVEKWVHRPEEAKSTPEPAAPMPQAAPDTGAPEAPAPAMPDITEAWVARESWEDQPVLDVARFELSSMGNPELRTMLASAFLTRTQQPLNRLRLAYAAGDAGQIEIHAHALHGLCVTMGAARAAALFESIASQANPDRLEAIEGWITRAESEVRAAIDAVEPRAEAA
jgi:CheY-like chemotaxis protein